MPLLCQDPPAPCPPAVPGTVFRSHPVSAGHGVLPSGMISGFISQQLFIHSSTHTSLFHRSAQQPQLFFPFSPLRAIWRITSALAGLQTLKLLMFWFSRRWRATLLQDSSIFTNTTSSTGACYTDLSLVAVIPILPSMLEKREASTWMVCAPSFGLFLQQHPGAAWVVNTNSSISDFVAGGEPLWLSVSAMWWRLRRRISDCKTGKTEDAEKMTSHLMSWN